VPSVAVGVIAKALGDYHRLYPGVRIHMREDLNEAIINAVKQNEVELGVACQLNKDPEVAFEPLFSDRLVVVAPVDHPVMKRRIAWQTVGQYPIILMAFGSAERALRLNNINVTPSFEVANMGTAVAMVRHGMGIAVIPNSALDGLHMEGLRQAPLPGPLSWRSLGVLRRSGRPLSTAALSFIEVLRAAVPENTAPKAH
jgi:LysR family carnitine catabolism transcriptional activator